MSEQPVLKTEEFIGSDAGVDSGASVEVDTSAAITNAAPTMPQRSLTQRQLPPQRWQIFPAQRTQAKQISQATALSPLLAQVLINRGIYTPEQAWAFLDPESQHLPPPLDEFPDLRTSLDLLVTVIENQQKILICGDYDADGMTSTALLMRSLTYLGGNVSYAIPSRMSEGYGVNTRIVEDFHQAGGSLLLTVDNGIAAYAPIARARELGLTVIITDHHEVPDDIPPANAILNPKLIRESSPYRGVAGVGVAYILAVCLAQRMDKVQDLTATLLGLFTLGTIADLAPLTGVNRRWVKRGLKVLPKSQIPGVQALIEVAGMGDEKALKPEAIGFRLGPRINAVGRIADPQIVIDLLTTDDIGVALQRALQCEEANKLRQQMCQLIEMQAVEWVEAQQEKGLLDLNRARVLVVVQPEWHHGVIGIVASRLVERYGVPVFIGTYEDKSKKAIRGSARSIPEFNVFEALQACDDLLEKYGGHRAAGGFSFSANKLRQVKSRLSSFACKHLQPEHLKPLVTVDVQAQLEAVDLALYHQIDRIHPCGIENPSPVFWTANVVIIDQKVIGKENSHLKLTIAHTSPGQHDKVVMKAIAWRWGTHYPLPRDLDIAYKVRLNEWKGKSTVELELVGVRLAMAQGSEQGIRPWTQAKTMAQAAKDVALNFQKDASLEQPSHSLQIAKPEPPAAVNSAVVNNARALPNAASELSAAFTVELPRTSKVPEKALTEKALTEKALPESKGPEKESVAELTTLAKPTLGSAIHVEFYHNKRRYRGTLQGDSAAKQLRIENAGGDVLLVQMSARQGILYRPEQAPQPIDIADIKYFNLIRAGLSALEVKQKTQMLMRKDELIEEKNELLAEKDRQITTLKAQVSLLEEKITQLSAEQQRQFAELETVRKAQENSIQGQEAHIEQLQVQTIQRTVQRTVPGLAADAVSFANSDQPALAQSDLAPLDLVQSDPVVTQSVLANPESATDSGHNMLLSNAVCVDATALKQQVRDAVGDNVWFCLQPASQKDLQAAYKNYQMVCTEGPDAHIDDYSDAGVRLSNVVEREVLYPFFESLCSFLLTQKATAIGDLSLRLMQQPSEQTLALIPPLLAQQWRSFVSSQLSVRSRPEDGVKIVKVKAKTQLSSGDRALITQFLEQWEHPMASCFAQKGRQAASSLDQIDKLRNIAVYSDRFLYQWQYELLHQLMAGKAGKGGLLRQIFAV